MLGGFSVYVLMLQHRLHCTWLLFQHEQGRAFHPGLALSLVYTGTPQNMVPKQQTTCDPLLQPTVGKNGTDFS